METTLSKTVEHPAVEDENALERIFREYRRLPVEGGERHGAARMMDIFQCGMIGEAALHDLLRDGPHRQSGV